MKKFMVLYMAPVEMIAEWMKTSEEERKASEAKMREEWNAWMGAHGSSVKETKGLGKTKTVTSSGVTDTKNGMMLYSVVEAESAEAAAKMFEGHPHLGIPGASVEVMEASPLRDN